MRRLGCLLAVVLLVMGLASPVAAGSFGGLSQQSVDPDVVVMTADVQADGDAVWTVAYRQRLADDNETQAFEELQADISNNESAYTDRFADRMGRTARTAENATGREMTIENVTVEARQESFGQTYGVVSYRFRWTNFAATGDGSIEIGDALSGLFLDGETSLTIQWPAAYEAGTIAPQPDEQGERSATWRGQQQFGTDEPRVVVTEAGSGGLNPALVGGTILVVLALVGIAVVARRRGLFGGDEPSAPPSAESQPSAVGTEGDEPEPAGEPAAADDTDEPTEPPADLLSNEEQVLQLVERHGGRIKQQQVASELDWTDAKTSQVISGLRDEDELETFRIGRENVVTFPDTDLTETDGENESEEEG